MTNNEINRTPGILAALSYLNLNPPPTPFIQYTNRKPPVQTTIDFTKTIFLFLIIIAILHFLYSHLS